jgi:hypothetical protein
MQLPREWPALAIQAIVLTVNTACLLSGQRGDYALFFTLSTALLIVLLGFQLVHQGFLFPYPVRTIPELRRTVESPGLDTWVLRITVYVSFFLMFWGLTESYWPPILMTLVVILLFFAWHKKISEWNTNTVQRGLAKRNSQGITKQEACPLCGAHPARITYRVEREPSGFQEIIDVDCDGDCPGSKIPRTRPLHTR